MNKRLFILLTCCLAIIGCQPRNSTKSRLQQRVNKYYTHIIKGEYSLSWDFLWHDAKRIRNRDEWTKFSLGFDTEEKLVEFHIKSISKYNFQKYTLGKVTIVAKQKFVKENRVEEFEGDENWIYENGDWFRHIENW